MVVQNKLSAKVIQKAVDQVSKDQMNIKPMGGQNSPFKQMLDSVSLGEQYASKLGFTDQSLTTVDNDVKAIAADGIVIDSGSFASSKDMPSSLDAVVNIVEEVNHGQMRLENLTQQLLHSGKNFSMQELLALQAHVYHVAQVTELVVKAADQGVGSVKAVLNTNIQ